MRRRWKRILYTEDDVDISDVEEHHIYRSGTMVQHCLVIKPLGTIRMTRFRAFLCRCVCGSNFVESEHRFSVVGFNANRVPYCGRCAALRERFPAEYRLWLFSRHKMEDQFQNNFEWFLECLGPHPHGGAWYIHQIVRDKPIGPYNAAWQCNMHHLYLDGKVISREALKKLMRIEDPDPARKLWRCRASQWIGPEV